jgi:acyl-CoA synthetase (AMP-forming)/AMP-acid ligase II
LRARPDMGMALGHVLRERAAQDAHRRAFIFLGEDNREIETLDYAQLDRLACALASELSRHTVKGDRVLLVLPSGLAFVLGFFACHYAGLVPVPVVPPAGRRVRDAVAAIAESCRASVAITSPAFESQTRAFFQLQSPRLPAPRLLTLDFDSWAKDASSRPSPGFRIHEPDLDETAFIQYTSGSTSAPKGVMVTHRNLLANLEMIAIAFKNDAASTHVGWAPLYHDMGLIANVLQPFYVGALSVLMSPRQFAQQPWLWLRAISDYRARVSGGPNFAYELCIQRRERALAQGLDLSCWRLAFNSAEPVQAATLRGFTESFASTGFRDESFYPCYGLADATLLVSGGSVAAAPVLRQFSKTGLESARALAPFGQADARHLVGAGSALAGETIAIVRPRTRELLADREVGEIWVAGPHVPSRYWGASAAACKQAFGGELGQFPGLRFLRTGDLGFIEGGEVFVTGRLKDMFIVRGRNIYPQDVEAVAQAAASCLRGNAGAAFSVGREDGEAVALVQEIHRSGRREDRVPVIAAIRRAVFLELDVTLDDIVIVEPGGVPKTSSGKVRRAEAKQRYLQGDYAGAAVAGADRGDIRIGCAGACLDLDISMSA